MSRLQVLLVGEVVGEVVEGAGPAAGGWVCWCPGEW